MAASESLKAASGDCAGLQANRPRRSRFQPSGRSFAIGTKSGPAMREKRVPERMPYKLLYCRLRRHSNSALSFDAEKRGYDTRRVRHGVALRLRSCAPRAAPRLAHSRGKRRAEAFGTFGPKSTRENFFFFSAFRWRKAAKATRPIPMSASGRLKAASGDYSRVCKQTVPAAVAFSLPSAFPPSEPSRESPCGVKNKAHVAETYLSLSYPLPPTAAPPIRTLTENDVRRLLVLLAPKVQGKST